jgi:membrane protease YdiL (CAAX protease family)
MLMGWLTLLGFPALGALVVYLFEEHPAQFELNFLYPFQWFNQIALGIGVGLLFGFTAWRIVQLPQLNTVRAKYGGMIKNLQLNTGQIWFISICAGVGEELFFRAVLQTYWGVPITSIFFVAIHGYLNFKNLPLFMYGVAMTVFITVLGYLKIYTGLLTPIVAHTLIDVVLLQQLSRQMQRE